MSLSMSKSDREKSDRLTGSEMGDSGVLEKRLELEGRIEQYCEHRSKETIKEDNLSMVKNIEGVILNSFKTAKKDADEKMFGLKVCQSVKRMIHFGGKEMSLMIDINLDFNKFRLEHHSASSVDFANRDELESIIAKEVLGAPQAAEFDLRFDVALYERQLGWDAEWESILLSQHSKEKDKSQKGKSLGTPAKADVLPTDNSEEKAKAWSEIVKKMKYLSQKAFLAEKDQFISDREKIGNAKRELARLNQVSAKEVVFNSRVSGYEVAYAAILNKIKAAVGDSPDFVRMLSTRVKLHLSREEILDPWAASNLSGIVQVLMDTYNKPSFVTFQSTLSSTMNFRCSDPSVITEPTKVVSEVSGIMNIWANMGFWAYMTRDIFFSVVLVNAMPESATKEKVMLKLNEHMQKLDNGEEQEGGIINSDAGDMPIFDTITQFLEVIQKSNTGKAQVALKQQAAAAQAAAQASAQARTQQVKFRAQQDAMMVQQQEDEAMAAQQSNGPARSAAVPQTQKRGGEWYKRPMTRQDNVTFELQGGKKIVYTATAAKCAQCAGNEPHQPTCYPNQCYRCGLYGHTKHLCRQDKSTHVVREPAHVAHDFGGMADAFPDPEY